MKAQEKFLDLVIYLVIVIIISLFFISCDKDLNGNGTIVVSIKNISKTLNSVKVSIKTSNYNTTQEINAYGDTWFDNLPPAIYSIHAVSYDNSSKTYLKSDTSVKVILRYRQNEYDLKLELK